MQIISKNVMPDINSTPRNQENGDMIVLILSNKRQKR